MLRRNSAPCIFYRNHGRLRIKNDGDRNLSALGSESKSIPDKIAHSSSEKHRVCKYFALAVACDRYVTFFSDQFIKLRNLFNRVTTVEKRSLNLLLRSISTSEKQQVV